MFGTATYKGGAAGKYAISAGKDSDAGHFTADAELTADLTDMTVTGAIDNFTGGDGKPRDWSVALKKNDLSDGGLMADMDSPAGSDTSVVDLTDSGAAAVWSMGGTASDVSGTQWVGQMLDNDNTGNQVPLVTVGSFHTLYGINGRMVGAFGTNCTTCKSDE